MRFSPAIAAVLVGACASVPVTPVAVSDHMQSVVVDGIRKRLKDPDSATFGPMRAARSDKTGKIRVCGTVNARNSFGGYTGAVRFAAHVVDTGGVAIVEDAAISSPGDDMAINAMCAAAHL